MKYFVSPLSSEIGLKINQMLSGIGEYKNYQDQEVTFSGGKFARLTFVEVLECELAKIRETARLHFFLLGQKSPNEPVQFIEKVKT